jgi:HlyD family secretion protein
MRKRLPAIIILILIIAATGTYVFYTRNSVDTTSVKVSGNIEVTDIRLSFRIAGRLDSLLVNEGDIVSKGQLIARLEKSDQELSLKQAQANVKYAQSVLAELETGSRKQEIEHARAELTRARAGVETARAQLKLAQADDERFSRLYKQGGISLREYQVYQTQFEIARNAHREALARLESAGQQLSLVEEGARSEKIDQARSQLKIAREGLQQAKLLLGYTDLYSPIDAVVLSKSTEPGEYMTPGSPVITIGDLSRPWLRAYINETDLGKVKLNQEVEVTSDTYPGKVYTGRISFISPEAEFTPKAVQTHEERVKLVYRIKIALENPEQELKPGMPADALIKLRE